jgi:hypothetical protein
MLRSGRGQLVMNKIKVITEHAGEYANGRSRQSAVRRQEEIMDFE